MTYKLYGKRSELEMSMAQISTILHNCMEDDGGYCSNACVALYSTLHALIEDEHITMRHSEVQQYVEELGHMYRCNQVDTSIVAEIVKKYAKVSLRQ